MKPNTADVTPNHKPDPANDLDAFRRQQAQREQEHTNSLGNSNGGGSNVAPARRGN